jgi:hypothetical protein
MRLHDRILRLLSANRSLLIYFGLMLCFRSAVAD